MVELLYGVFVKDGSTRREIKPPRLQLKREVDVEETVVLH
jgi:hypothetical protein